MIASSAALAAQEDSPVAKESSACAGGVIKDDGSVETGYGFVPSVPEGTYLQAFSRQEFEHEFLDRVCVCWLKTRGDREIDFEVQLYSELAGRPAPTPLARVKARAEGVAQSVAAAGSFVEVDMNGMVIPDGPFYIGVQWDPSEASFLFVCVDRGEQTAKTGTFYREGRGGWTSVEESRDPIFRPHRALMVRARSRAEQALPSVRPPASAPPTLGPGR